MKRPQKSGLGTAYIAGFKWALNRNYEYILEMDADFSHPPAKLVELMESCASGNADVSVGSRSHSRRGRSELAILAITFV